jgi:hypothetical protein
MPINGKRYPFVEYAIAGAPADPGVFALWEGDELIYIGAAQGNGATLQSALKEHLKGLFPCTLASTHYSWELARNVKTLEQRVLEEFRNSFRRLPRCNQA